ncbi:MAG: hypothetical protein ACI8UD_001843 [Planctomycetota bacterium]|jgi:hypothetical protein
MKRQAVRHSTALLLAASVVMSGCQGFASASPATQQLVRAMELSERIPADQFLLEIESPYLAGVFDVLFVVEQQSMRAQLFPDVGGKVLDLTVGPDAITATMPGESYRAEPPLQQAEPHLALVVALMLSELMAPVTAARVVGERIGSEGLIEVQLRPALGAGEVTAELARSGRIHRYQIRLGVLSFTLDADGAFAGRGFSGRLCP